jgi:hypothetical protein
MSRAKSIHRARRRADRRGDNRPQRSTRDPRPLLPRILESPHLAQVVPRLPPEILYRVIQRCGLEDCGELVTLATPDQLAHVLDLDLWRTSQPGEDEQLDADRFGVWLEVLVESGAAVAAQTLAGMDADLVAVALAQHVRLFDLAAVPPASQIDGDEDAALRAPRDGPECDIGGYRVVAVRTDSWDAIVAALIALDAEHRDCFHRVMGGCRSLSNSKPEIDGLDDLLTDCEQRMFDVAVDREERREGQGYAPPNQARTFLQMSRELRLAQSAMPPDNPVAGAYFRAVQGMRAAEATTGPRRLPAISRAPSDPQQVADAVAAFVDVLIVEGVVTQQPRGLLGGPADQPPRLARIQRHMQFAADCDPTAYSMRGQELAYLANAIVAGCSIQGRPFTVRESSDAAVAVCNLGLENWPPHWLASEERRGWSAVETGTPLPDEFLVGHDLVRVFQVGWTVLHDNVSMYAAQRLVEILSRLQCDDRELQAGLDALRLEMKKHWQAGAPWRARDSLDVIMILDMPAWAALVGLIAECPVIHAGIGASRGSPTRSVDASAFEFISENSQIASVGAFMQSLPGALRA